MPPVPSPQAAQTGLSGCKPVRKRGPQVAPQPRAWYPGYEMGYVLSYIGAAVVLSVLVNAAGALALRLLRRWALGQRDPVQAGSQPDLGWPTQWMLGLAVWIYVLFVLASLQVLVRPVVYGFALVGILAFVALHFRGWQRQGYRRTPSFPPAVRLPFLAICGLFLAANFVLALWPVVSRDASTYHVTVPRLYIAAGGFVRIPFNVYSNWPLNIEMLFTLAMLIKDYVLANLVHFGLAVLIVMILYRECARVGRPLAGAIAAGLFLADPAIQSEMVVAYVDIGSAFFLLFGFLSLIHYFETRQSMSLVLAGIACGVLAGTKWTGVFGVLCLVPLLWIDQARGARRAPAGTTGGRFRPTLQFVLPCVALAVPWYVRSVVLTGDPLYPLLHDWLGGPEWNGELTKKLLAWQNSIGMGRSIEDYLLLPVRVALKGNTDYQSFGARLNPLWLAVVPLALVLGRTHPTARKALGVAGLYFVLWAFSSQQSRFLIPILPLLALAAGLAVDRALESIPNRRSRSALVALFWVASAVLIAVQGNTQIGQSFRVAGRMFTAGEQIREVAVHPVFRYINERTPRDSRVMMLNTNQGFFCERDYIADSFFEASQLGALLSRCTDKLQLRQLLKELRITHILIWNREYGIDYPLSLHDFLEDAALATPIQASPQGEFVLYGVSR